MLRLSDWDYMGFWLLLSRGCYLIATFGVNRGIMVTSEAEKLTGSSVYFVYAGGYFICAGTGARKLTPLTPLIKGWVSM